MVLGSKSCVKCILISQEHSASSCKLTRFLVSRWDECEKRQTWKVAKTGKITWSIDCDRLLHQN